jgi:hypothetical protein
VTFELCSWLVGVKLLLGAIDAIYILDERMVPFPRHICKMRELEGEYACRRILYLGIYLSTNANPTLFSLKFVTVLLQRVI